MARPGGPGWTLRTAPRAQKALERLPALDVYAQARVIVAVEAGPRGDIYK